MRGKGGVEEKLVGGEEDKWYMYSRCSGYVTLCNCPPLLLCFTTQGNCVSRAFDLHYKASVEGNYPAPTAHSCAAIAMPVHLVHQVH